jgi:hypothetical protein
MLETRDLEGFSTGGHVIEGLAKALFGRIDRGSEVVVRVKKVGNGLTGKHEMTAGSKPSSL